MNTHTGHGSRADDLTKTTGTSGLGADQSGSEELSEAELQTLAGGVAPKGGSDSCKATTDTNMMGCPG